LDEDHSGDWGYGSAYDHLFYVLGSSPNTAVGTSKNASGYGVMNGVTGSMGFDSSPHASYDHRIIEFQVNLTAINYTTPPSTMGMLVLGYGTLAPNYFSTDGANASNYYTNDTCVNWTDLKFSNQYYLSGRITNEIIPIMITLTEIIITVSVLFVFVKGIRKIVKRI